MHDFSNQVVLVTGASRGIGRKVAEEFASRGAYVVMTSRSQDSIEAAAREVRAKGGEALAAAMDVGQPDQVQSALSGIREQVEKVDILVNNAGITRDGTVHKMSYEDWKAVVDTHLGSCFNMSRAVIEGMRERKFGRIVNVGSINGQAGQYGQVSYAAAKSGIHGFTKALAQEGAGVGITVNAIAPGYIDTDMVAAVPERVLEKIVERIPVKRLGKAEEIARAITFLTDDDAGFITGSTLSINGGQHMY